MVISRSDGKQLRDKKIGQEIRRNRAKQRCRTERMTKKVHEKISEMDVVKGEEGQGEKRMWADDRGQEKEKKDSENCTRR